jgi:hypothetical protein
MSVLAGYRESLNLHGPIRLLRVAAARERRSYLAKTVQADVRKKSKKEIRD